MPDTASHKLSPPGDREISLVLLTEDYDEDEIERLLTELFCGDAEQEWARSLLHTFSGAGVFWKVFRRPPDIEDLPY